MLHLMLHDGISGMDQEISLREVNRGFASYLRAVEQGESFVITRRGKPVARLVPVKSPLVPAETGRVLTPEQQAARERALERMQRGFRLGGAKFNRDELYDERCGGSGDDA